MTFDTKPPLPTAAQVISEQGPHVGLVATDAVHGQTVSRISGAIPNRMSEAYVFFMALTAYAVRICLKHGRLITAVELMTIGATGPLRMPVQHFGSSTECVGVAGATYPALIGRQQSLSIPGMCIMTGQTYIFFLLPQQVGMGALKSLQRLLMALQTHGGCIWPVMALAAVSGGKRGVPNLAQQPLPVTTMRRMTVQAGHRIGIPPKVPDLQFLSIRMTPQTQLRIRFLDQAGILRSVGSVTGRALALGVGGMGLGISLTTLGVTGKTTLGEILRQQPAVGRSVGRMTVHTAPPGYRIMKKGILAQGFFNIPMTGEAKSGFDILQKRLMFGHVGRVTDSAPAFLHRRMYNPALESEAFMA